MYTIQQVLPPSLHRVIREFNHWTKCNVFHNLSLRYHSHASPAWCGFIHTHIHSQTHWQNVLHSSFASPLLTFCVAPLIVERARNSDTSFHFLIWFKKHLGHYSAWIRVCVSSLSELSSHISLSLFRTATQTEAAAVYTISPPVLSQMSNDICQALSEYACVHAFVHFFHKHANVLFYFLSKCAYLIQNKVQAPLK